MRERGKGEIERQRGRERMEMGVEGEREWR